MPLDLPESSFWDQTRQEAKRMLPAPTPHNASASTDTSGQTARSGADLPPVGVPAETLRCKFEANRGVGGNPRTNTQSQNFMLLIHRLWVSVNKVLMIQQQKQADAQGKEGAPAEDNKDKSMRSANRHPSQEPVKLSPQTSQKEKVAHPVATNNNNNSQQFELSEHLEETTRFLQLLEEIQRTANPSDVVIRARPKKTYVDSARGSKYRGVSKNGKKWQVSGNPFRKSIL